MFDIKQLDTYNPNNVGLGRKFNKYNYEYGSNSNESIFSQVISLPFDKSQFFTLYDSQLYSSFFETHTSQQDNNFGDRVELIYKFDFIGENKNNWNNWITDKHLSLQDKFVFSRIGKIRYTKNTSKPYESIYKNFDMNNAYLLEKDGSAFNELPSMYKKIYTFNKQLIKRNIQFKNNEILKNNLFPSNVDLLDDMSIFDNQDFTIELTIYPGHIASELDDVEINLSRPYDPSKLLINRYNPCLPYNIYEY